jgi:hypothetical protein
VRFGVELKPGQHQVHTTCQPVGGARELGGKERLQAGPEQVLRGPREETAVSPKALGERLHGRCQVPKHVSKTSPVPGGRRTAHVDSSMGSLPGKSREKYTDKRQRAALESLLFGDKA